MPLRILYDQSFEKKIGFSYSPHGEMILSLRVLRNAKHHATHLQWAVETKRRMDRTMLADLRYFGRGFREYSLLSDLIAPEPAGELKPFDEEREEMACLSDVEFAYRILRESCDLEEVDQALEGGESALEPFLERFQDDPGFDQADGPSSASSFFDITAQRQAVRDLLSDPPAFRARLTAFLKRYWEEVFAATFERLEPWFLADIAEKARLLRTLDAPSLLMQLSDKIVAEPTGQDPAAQRRWPSTAYINSVESVTITPTYFGTPHLILGINPDHLHLWYDLAAKPSRTHPQPVPVVHQSRLQPFQTLSAPLQPSTAPDPLPQVPVPSTLDPALPPEISPDRLVLLLRAVADEMRLTILKLIAQRRRTTQELAQALSITAPSVSRHLRILKEAGLLTSEAEGYFVYYSLLPHQTAALGHHLANFLCISPDPVVQ